MALVDNLEFLDGSMELLITILSVFLMIFIINFTVGIIKKHMLKKAKTKKQISNIKILTRIFSIILIIIVCFIAFFSYLGSLTWL